tara:strand:- start:2115 stop:2288 length:174 start_codon:yes stop_codon:yes gene_type:complete
MNKKVLNEFVLPVGLALILLVQISNYVNKENCITVPPTVEKMKNIEFSTNNKRYKFK